ncbi:MAG: hypothetical protein QOC67_4389, partial [Pseudonocardiales bacterium]|nr:hypothetical protein [Pseudonocardiales bacterium]
LPRCFEPRESPVSWLSSAFIDPAVHELFPDYRASLVLAENLQPGPSDEVSEKLLADAESRYRGGASWDEHPHIAAWRAAFRALGSKPQKFRPSVDALLRRVPDGLPRINRLTDVYNAVSIAHVVPVGGEDVAAYRGPPGSPRRPDTACSSWTPSAPCRTPTSGPQPPP